MLTRVIIENFALIDSLNVEFDSGLNIITGETGAGKSIILGAMGLIMGAKADVSTIKNSTKNCFVEMHFSVDEASMKSVFDAYDLDFDVNTTIRRVIATDGKSRAYVNDLPVNQGVLKEVTAVLIDIHSQHQTLLLGDNRFQTDLVDKVARHESLLANYKTSYEKTQQLKAELKKLRDTAENQRKDFDYITFQRDQLVDAKLVSGEQEELETNVLHLTHAGEINEAMYNGGVVLNGDETGVITQLKHIGGALHKLSKLYTDAEQLAERVNSVVVELKDIAEEMDVHLSKVEVNPERLAQYEQKLDMIYSLQQKHKVQSVDELIALLEQYNVTLDRIESSDDEIKALEQSIDNEENAATKLAEQITANRLKSAPIIKKHVESGLVLLGIANARFEVEITPKERLDGDGADCIRFIFSANKNASMQPIEKIASGGEMSRLMLTLKALIAKHKNMPTIIFDEIDTGISGETAHKMGAILESMAADMQIINITHLPQIAARGDHHYFVYKAENESGTTTQIRKLNHSERVSEIAKMLSGSGVTEAALKQAEILLNS